ICGGTPCQAFSLAGLKRGLTDHRGNLTLKFVDIIEANDKVRRSKNQEPTVILWENVEGVLKDKTNAFGSFISALAGLNEVFEREKWPNAGVLKGPKRNVAWRVLDAKYFGLPQQRKRLYVLAGGKDFEPEKILFERAQSENLIQPKTEVNFEKNGKKFEVFREYTDCLYSAYGTKWNGNAAAYNGSLFVVQDENLRRFSPLECERLMGIPDNYTNISRATRTNRYQAIGNAWAVPVIKWIGYRILNQKKLELEDVNMKYLYNELNYEKQHLGFFVPIEKDFKKLRLDIQLNCTLMPNEVRYGDLEDIVTDEEVPDKIYISPVGCFGILRRAKERKIKLNSRLEAVLRKVASQMSEEEIDKISRRQKRGKHGESLIKEEISEYRPLNDSEKKNQKQEQMSLFNI